MCNNQIKTAIARTVRQLLAFVVMPWLMLALSGCGDSPKPLANPDNGNNDTSDVYKGPAPNSPDAQSFRIEFWEPLRTADRCGNCHSTGQSPMFVNIDDINVAYDNAKTVVDVTNPANSIIVAKVGQGHNCWLADNRACADIIQRYITNWLGSSSGSGRAIVLTAPFIRDPGDSKNFPSTAQTDPDLTDGSNTSFANTVYPILQANCSGCHASNAAAKQAPFFADEDVNAAYEAAKAKINLSENNVDVGDKSRLVIRLRNEFHNCWSDCNANATTMKNAIIAFAGSIPQTVIDPALVTSKAMQLGDAIIASGGSRTENNVIALWEFKEGTGTTAYDTSGVNPAVNMQLSGGYQWVSGYGVEFAGGKGQGDTTSSKKIHDRILQTGEYSIEAWVVPANVTQDNRSIITYSNGGATHNFTMGQSMYNYDFINHTTLTDGTDNSKLSTDDDDEDLQTSLQHVVMNFDPVNGRQIFVNGVSTGDADLAGEKGGSIATWDDSFPLVFGSEQGGGATAWSGKLRMVAIHNRVLSAADIRQNYSVGVGQKYLMLFSVADRIGVPDSYIMFEVEQYDNYAYLFSSPKFINLSSTWVPSSNITIKGMRIGINGKEAVHGQVFGNMNATITAADYSTVDGQLLSSLGTVIAVEKGADDDEFFLSFEQLGTATHNFVEADPVVPNPPVDAEQVSDIGVRTFDEINATMSAVTGIPVTNTSVNAIFTSYRRQLPAVENIQAYLSSHQMAVAQLAMTYCDRLVETNPGFFPAFNFSLTPSTAFSSPDSVLNPLLTAIMNIDTSVPSKNLATQPGVSVVKNMLSSNSVQDLEDNTGSTSDDFNSLIDCMTRCERGLNECSIYVDTANGDTAACTGGEIQNTTVRTKQVVKATCAAVLGSSVMLVQ
ncbi:MAG: LamG domain-containing protein [Gammaproteobacteria bacterium]|nr:LamG domain-containing protein [Gammaproteobacteria bacterium]